MTKKEIIESVGEYIRDDKMNYAILINGAWGSGKTFLYKNYLVKEIDKIEVGKNNRKTNIYISLYGISTIEELAKEVLSNFFVYSSFKGKRRIKQLYKPVTGMIDIATKAISFSMGPVSTNFNQLLNRIEKMIKPRNMVICFDDLERCVIPVNDFFGFVNNLVEHCNSKVIILADEDNIGKIYANTDIEMKYQTILTGNRKVIEARDKKKNPLGTGNTDDVTIEELKTLNEKIFSENYIYRDIKEKVIGRSYLYYPTIKDTIIEIINGDEEIKSKAFVCNKDYRDFLNNRIDEIASRFRETDNINLRIIMNWIVAYEDIFRETEKYFSKSQYYEDIVEEFLRYSIWVASSMGRNKKIFECRNYGNTDYVFFEGHEYTHIHRYGFIDAWIKRNVKDIKDLCTAAKIIEDRKERENENNPKVKRSEGKKLIELGDWFFMSDVDVKQKIQELLCELKENKYVYSDYSTIICRLIQLQEAELYEDDIYGVQRIMVELIESDDEIQTEDDFPKTFKIESQMEKYNELYNPIKAKRKERNQQLDKKKVVENRVCESSDSFLEYCRKNENYFLSHRSFTEYVDIDEIFNLVKETSLKGIYDIAKAFSTIYYMENARDFYVADIDNLIILRKRLQDPKDLEIIGKTHKYAIDYLCKVISDILLKLGYEE